MVFSRTLSRLKDGASPEADGASLEGVALEGAGLEGVALGVGSVLPPHAARDRIRNIAKKMLNSFFIERFISLSNFILNLYRTQMDYKHPKRRQYDMRSGINVST